MKNWFKHLFDDSNTINEKSVVGYLAFIMLLLVILADIITGLFGKHLIINEFIFDGFLILVLGAFGISSIDKWLNKRNNNTDTNKENNTTNNNEQ